MGKKHISVHYSQGKFYINPSIRDRIGLWIQTIPSIESNASDLQEVGEGIKQAYDLSNNVKTDKDVDRNLLKFHRKLFDRPETKYFSLTWLDDGTVSITPMERHPKSGKRSFGWQSIKNAKINLANSNDFYKIAEMLNSLLTPL